MGDIPVPNSARSPRYLDRLRAFMSGRRLAYRTEGTRCGWMWDGMPFHKMGAPEEMGKGEMDEWLGHLDSQRNVSINR